MGWLISDLSATGPTYTYSSSQNNVNFFVDAGSPTSGNWNIVILPGVTIGSTDKDTPAATTGVFPRTLTIKNRGRIQGKGGAGGVGAAVLGTYPYGKGQQPAHNGSGGGGAGSDGGIGGHDVGPPSGPGEDGTSEAGGAGSASLGNTNPYGHSHGATHNLTPPAGQLDGGDALQLDMDVTIHNQVGELWGGGGGGGPANIWNGGSGGGPGENGTAEYYSDPNWRGVAGKAIELQGNSITWGGGSESPHVKGAVS